MTKYINLVLAASCILAGVLLADDKNIKIFYQGASWPKFKCPSSFHMDERSFKGEEFKWVVIYQWPEKKLTLEVSPYGFVSETYKEEGFDSPRDVVLIYQLTSARRIKRQGFEIFIQEGEDKTNVIFLEDNPKFGNCYNTMVIKYPSGKSRENRPIIKDLIDNFIPSFIVVLQGN